MDETRRLKSAYRLRSRGALSQPHVCQHVGDLVAGTNATSPRRCALLAFPVFTSFTSKATQPY